VRRGNLVFFSIMIAIGLMLLPPWFQENKSEAVLSAELPESGQGPIRPDRKPAQIIPSPGVSLPGNAAVVDSIDFKPSKKVTRAMKKDSDFLTEPLPLRGLKLVTNYRASGLPAAGAGGPIPGFETLETQDAAELNIVFDEKRQRYAVWSRELVVRGQEAAIAEFKIKYDLEVMSEGPVTILRVPTDVNLKQVLADLDPSLSVEPDLAYGRPKPQ
jgi:hypothetical protein